MKESTQVMSATSKDNKEVCDLKRQGNMTLEGCMQD